MAIPPEGSVGMRTGGPIALLVAAALAAAGCHGPPCLPSPPAPPELVPVPRQLAEPDVSRVPADPPPAPEAPPPGPYYRLTAEDCHRLACAHAAVARVIDLVSADSQRSVLDFTPKSVDELRRTVGGHLSREARIRTAAAALDLYYRLLEAELLADVAAESQKDLDELVKVGGTMTERGFKESTDFFQLRKQQVEMRADRARLQAGIDRLNAELKFLIGLPNAPGRLLPADRIEVTPDPIDPEQAVRIGLATRPDLLVLRALADGLDARTFVAVQQAFTGLVPSLAAVSKATRVLAPGLRALVPVFLQPDVAALRRQIVTLLAAREQEAAKDIRTAVGDWAGERELVGVARKQVELQATRVRELEVKRKAGAAVELDYRRARLDLLKARSDLIREAVKWRQADVKARQAMGLLCGGEGCEVVR